MSIKRAELRSNYKQVFRAQISLHMSDKEIIARDYQETNHNLELFTSIANHGGALGRLGLGIAKEVTDFAFETAKLSTRIGLGISKTIVGAVGIDTTILDVAEFFAILGIEVGHGITTFSLQGSTQIVKLLQECFGDKDSIQMAIEFGALLQREFERTGKQIGYYDMWRCFSAWIAVHKKTNSLWAEEFVLPNVSVTTLDDPTKRYIRFANGAYGEQAIHFLKGSPKLTTVSEKIFYAEYCGISTSDVSSVDSKHNLLHSEYSPAYFLSIDHQEKQLVVAFRGTLSARDAIVDLACEPITLCLENEAEEHALHGGMLRVVSKLSQPNHPSGLYSSLEKYMNQYTDYGLVLTGHSLGAGLASILGILWANSKTGRIKSECGLPDRKIHVYAYACPSVMDTALGKQCEPFITSCVIGWDWLARISMFNVLEIRDAVIWLKQQDEIEPGLVNSILEKSETTLNNEQIQELYSIRTRIIRFHSEETNNPWKLFPAGKITWIHESIPHFVQDRQPVFGELLFTKDNFTNHLPLVYEEILSQL
jgi:hypothetical protein